MAEAKKRKGTALLAVMNENCSSCAGSPICEAHCPVDDCINLLYEELPQGGLKPYRVFVDNDKCIGCQMCYSDDLTKIQQHKETGEIFYEYANRFYDANRKPIAPDAVPKIKRIFAKSWTDQAKPGWWIQDTQGNWKKK